MNKRNIVGSLLLFVFTASIFALNIIIIENAKAQLSNVTQLNYNDNSNSYPKALAEIEKLFERITNKGIGFCSEGESTKFKGELLTPVLVNENLFSIYNTKISGDNISAENIMNKDRVAIIGSQLALKLYFTTEAVGKKIDLDGEIYTVCGVIDENESLINKLSEDGKQRVYIPYTTDESYKICSADIIAYDNSVHTAVLIEQMDLSQYYSVNLSEKSKTLVTFEHILYFSVFIGICVIALKIWRRFSKRLFNEIRENLGTNYFLKSLKSIPVKYILFVLVLIGIPALLLVIFNFCDFGIFISSKYIPNDNIFDVSHYINKIIDNAQEVNSLSLAGDSSLINLFARTFTSAVWLTAAFVICFGCMIYKLCAILFCKMQK